MTAITDNEVDVLRQLADGKTNVQIGEQLGISEEAVKGRLKRLRRRRGLRNRVHAATFAIEHALATPLVSHPAPTSRLDMLRQRAEARAPLFGGRDDNPNLT